MSDAGGGGSTLRSSCVLIMPGADGCQASVPDRLKAMMWRVVVSSCRRVDRHVLAKGWGVTVQGKVLAPRSRISGRSRSVRFRLVGDAFCQVHDVPNAAGKISFEDHDVAPKSSRRAVWTPSKTRKPHNVAFGLKNSCGVRTRCDQLARLFRNGLAHSVRMQAHFGCDWPGGQSR